MPETTNWTGSASGARTGTMTVEITRDGTHMQGTLRLLEPGVGELQSRFEGQWTTDNKLSAQTLEQFISNLSGVVTLPQIGNMEGTFDARENVITGRWRTEADALGDFRWIRAGSPPPKPRGRLAALYTPFVQQSERSAAGVKMFFERKWDKRYDKWVVLVVQLLLAGCVGYLVVAFVIDLLVGN